MGGGQARRVLQPLLREVAGAPADLSRYHTPSYRALFYEALPLAMHRLLVDPSPAAQVRASVTYNMVTEGVLAETGYHGYFTGLAAQRPHARPGAGISCSSRTSRATSPMAST
jgi:ribonucleoside-diphosphate reductase beta chain